MMAVRCGVGQVERARETVEGLVSSTIEQIRPRNNA